MARIFSDCAYDDARVAECYWSEAVSNAALKRPRLKGEVRSDVAIIGAGFTGLSAALALAEAGASVTVLDACFPGWGASGRNGGFCCLGGAKAPDAMLDRTHGKPARLAYRRAELAAVRYVETALERYSIDAETHGRGETLLAHKPGLNLEAEIASIEENYGVTPTYHPPADLDALGMIGPFHGALTTPVGFGLNPRLYLRGLLAAAELAGAQIHGESPVESLTRANGYTLTTPQGTLKADTLILATNGYASEDVPPWMAARYLPSQSSIIVTRELNEAELAAGWSSAQMAYDSRTLLHYFRLMPGRRFLFGMRGGLFASPRSEARIRSRIRADFDAMFPAWRRVETPFYWSGMVCLSAGLTPFAGSIPDMPGAYAGFAYHGNGVAMGSYTGALLADQILRAQKLDTPELMRKPPKRFPFGRARRLLMPAIYGAAILRDF